jgi:hypothetical protein
VGLGPLAVSIKGRLFVSTGLIGVAQPEIMAVARAIMAVLCLIMGYPTGYKLSTYIKTHVGITLHALLTVGYIVSC